MHATLALANGQSVTGRVKNSDVTRQSEMGVRVKPEAFANAPAVEYYHAQTGRRIDERDILQMSLPERAKFVVREGVANCNETSTSRVSAVLYAEVDVKKYLQDERRLLRQRNMPHPLNFFDQVRQAELNTLYKKLDVDDGDEVIFDLDNLLEAHADFCDHIMSKAQVSDAKEYAEKFFHAEDPKVLHQRALPFPAGVTHRIVLNSSDWARSNPINSGDIKKLARGMSIFARNYKDELRSAIEKR